MGTSLTVRPPSDFDLARDVCSYGYFVLAPNEWKDEVLHRVLTLPDGPAKVRITQFARGAPLRIASDRALSRAEQQEARRQVSRMLRLGEDESSIASFHEVDPRWKESGRGRIFRSPTLFEDVIKTVTSCNVQWSSTKQMNTRLCEVVGQGAFPTPAKLARVRANTLRARCRVGYRDQRMIDLGRLFRDGEVEENDLVGLDDEALRKRLLALPGIGPYAANNIMQLLGRYGSIPFDSEAMRHAKEVHGMTGTEASIRRAFEAHYERYGEHRFRSYWFEIWTRS